MSKHKLLPCPNPSCWKSTPKLWKDCVGCDHCNMRGPRSDLKLEADHHEDATRLWNALPREAPTDPPVSLPPGWSHGGSNMYKHTAAPLVSFTESQMRAIAKGFRSLPHAKPPI